MLHSCIKDISYKSTNGPCIYSSMKTRAGKRTRVAGDKKPARSDSSPKPSKKQKLPPSRNPSAEDPGSLNKPTDLREEPRLTRHRAKSLGAKPTEPTTEPERLLRQASRQQSPKEEDKRAEMERKPPAGGPAPQVRGTSRGEQQPALSSLLCSGKHVQEAVLSSKVACRAGSAGGGGGGLRRRQCAEVGRQCANARLLSAPRSPSPLDAASY